MPQFALAHGRSGQHQVDASLINPNIREVLGFQKEAPVWGPGLRRQS
jgi:hypothetical protein